MDPLFILILILVLGFLFDYTNGFHDAANVVSTVIATRALRPIVAIVMAGVLNVVGASHTSGVAETIASGLIAPQDTTSFVIICSLTGAISWNFLTWYWGLPSSSSYALVGGLLGATLANAGKVYWLNLTYKVLIPMILSPLLGFGFAFLLMRGLYAYLAKYPHHHEHKFFRHLQIASACLIAISHGLNDAQKSMGIITLGLFSTGHLTSLHIPLWVVFSCALMMGIGTLSGGFRIIHTMGFSIARLQPAQGFAAECSSSLLILAASFLGIPISSTHMIAGSITGVGTARNVQAVHWNIPKQIALAWIWTLPGAGVVSGLLYLALSLIGLV